jgi:hypothetical protein
MIFVRRLIHYLHNSWVEHDSSDTDHLPALSTMNGVRNLFSLFVIAVFANVLDERTYKLPTDSFGQDLTQCYQVFDYNAIPIVERHHLCHARGLTFDLIRWFHDHYSLSYIDPAKANDVHPYFVVLIPFTIHIGRQIIRYKRAAEACEIPSSSSIEQVTYQVESAVGNFNGMEEAYQKAKADNEARGYRSDDSDHASNPEDLYDLSFSFNAFTVDTRPIPLHDSFQNTEYLEKGQNDTDRRFFQGFSHQFDLNLRMFPVHNSL